MSTKRFAVLTGAIALACSAWAQEAPDQYQPDQSYQAGQFDNVTADSSTRQVDPPGRVARVARLSGDVSFAPAGESEWSRAQRNRPMATGDRLYTNSGARAELQIGAASVQIDARSSFDFLNLDDRTVQMELTQGALNLDVRRLRGGEVYEIDTPTIAFIADRAGDYRVDVDPNGRSTTVSVRRGSGEAVGEGGKRLRVDPGQAIVFNDSQLTDYRDIAQRRNDDFDGYVTERSERYDRGDSRRYVSEEVVGSEDLDDYGSWEDAPEYGHVWYPREVAADWAPYHNGSWDWVEPWGWTWVDDSPWGYAPFHYGRWAYIGSRWGWVPGPIDVAPVYAPALVAFVGGGGFGIDISIGGPIGWFALAPGEVYFPTYPCGHSYFNSVNFSNTVVNNTVVNNYYGAFAAGNVNYAQMRYANRTAPRAMTAVSATAFTSGRPVASSAIAVNRNMLANARVLPRATVTPTQASLVAGRGRATTPPATVLNRTVVAATHPAPARTPFAQRQALLRQDPGRPLTSAQTRTLATQNARGLATHNNNNVRVAGAAGVAAAPAVSARSTVTAPGKASTQRVAPATMQHGGVGTAQSRGASSAQLRSSGFAHGGNVPRESTTAQQHASANARFERGTAHPSPGPHESATAQQHASANARFERGNNRLPSSGFAHGNTPREAVAAQQHASPNARFERSTARPVSPSREAIATQSNTSAQARVAQHATENRPMHSSSFAAQNREPTPRTSAAATRANEHAQARTSERAQTEIRTPRPVERAPASVRETQRAQAQYHAPERVPSQVREQPHAVVHAPPAQRVNEQPRAVPTAPHSYEPPRAQAQYREPPRPTGQREQAPRQQAKRKDEKRDQGGGG